MKKIILAVVLMSISFVCGIVWEYTAHIQEINEIEQVAQESCDVRIKTIKETCKGV